MDARPLHCPDCGTPLAGPPWTAAQAPEEPREPRETGARGTAGAHAACPRCRLPLTGPDADELRDVIAALAETDARRRVLLDRRTHLLYALRARRTYAAPAQHEGTREYEAPGRPHPGDNTAGRPPRWGDHGPYGGGRREHADPGPAHHGGAHDPYGGGGSARASAYGPYGGGGFASAGPGGPRPDASAPSVQAVLLVLGGLLLTLAGLAFTLVNWGRLGIGGRAAVLAGLTALALAAPVPLRRRRLTATAETAACVGFALVLLDWYAARAAGLAGLGRTDAAAYWAAATALTGLAAAACARRARFTVLPYAALALLQFPVPLTTAAADAAPAGRATAAIALAALDLAAARAALPLFRRTGRGPALAFTALSLTALWSALGGALAARLALTADAYAPALRACVPLAALAAMGAGAAARGRTLPHPARVAGAFAAGLALAVAAAATPRLALPASWGVLAFAVPAALLAAAVLPAAPRRPFGPTRTGLAAAAALVLTGALLTVLPAAAKALVEPAARALPGAERNGFPRHWGVPGAVPAVVLLAAALTAWTAVRVRAAVAGAPREATPRAATPGTVAAATPAVSPAASGLVTWTAATAAATAACAASAATAAVALALAALAGGLPYAAVLTAASLPALAAAVRLRVPTRRESPGRAVEWAVLLTSAVIALTWSLPVDAAALTVWGAAVAVSAAMAGPEPRAAAFTVVAAGAEAARAAVTAGLAPHTASFAALAVAVASAPVAAALRRPPYRKRVASGEVTAEGGAQQTPSATNAETARRLGAARAEPGVSAPVPPQPPAEDAAANHRPGDAEAGPRVDAPVQRARSAAEAAVLRSLGVESAGYAVGGAALVAAAGDAGALSAAMAVSGAAACGVALRADRRGPAALVATALLTGALWIRLALAAVQAPEPYTLPVAAAVLVLGMLRRRRARETGSWQAYGAGLALGLLPGLGAAFADTGWTRPLLLGLAALAATLAGARRRLQAPLLLGGAVLLCVALDELAPALARTLTLVPRWVPPAAAGLLLVYLGATYERRLAEGRRLRATLRRMG